MWEVTTVKLKKSMKKHELYTEMLAETVQQPGRLWGDYPAAEWISEMRMRSVAQEGEMYKFLTEAYEEEAKKMRKVIDEITPPSGWDTIRTEEF